ncbi:HET-domain-containing protein [Rhizodiscina lignyota]|uniref:HET-domain-containing protein n=1 Tax=Rhizodiscina lignyota TaxID=1504668 RepID=A0A9P4M4T4_9PEZI|nr:HET-domain-containing protein [Rhizodiscina lignyota]
MRLLQCVKAGKFQLTRDFIRNDEIPPYAILSHTWTDGEEVTFQDLTEGTGNDKAGFQKIRFCAEQAERDNLRYFWVDTCCIDKTNSVELQEAINSMFRCYQKAARCYVYLSDVSTAKRKAGSLSSDPSAESTWELALKESRWFTRGWTLQELLAPLSVEFFSREGKRLGDKRSLEREINETTGISISALKETCLSGFSVHERFKWAENRSTTRDEDQAYSLLGIFGIHMSLIYGEGKESALKRLREKIDKPSKVCLRAPLCGEPVVTSIEPHQTRRRAQACCTE